VVSKGGDDLTRADSTEDRLLASAQELLLEGGIASVTTEAIARRARISKKTLYRLYDSKDALMAAALDAFVEANLAEWDRILDRDASAIDRIAASLAFVAEVMQRVQTRVLDQVEQVAPALWHRIEEARARRFARLKGLLEEAQAVGDVRADIDLDLWLYLLTTTVRAAVSRRTVAGSGYRLPELVQGITTIYCDGLLTPQGDSKLVDTEEGR